jgi:hypothetical protein
MGRNLFGDNEPVSWYDQPITYKGLFFGVVIFLGAELVAALVYFVITELWDRRQ